MICKVCGRELLQITTSHLKLHNMTFDDYTKLYGPTVFNPRKKVVQVPPITQKELVVENTAKNVLQEIYKNQIQEDELEDKTPAAVKFLKNSKDPSQIYKMKVFKHLKSMHKNLIPDYWIGEYITDFADPVKKVCFFFVSAIWHNRQFISVDSRNSELKENGWTVNTIKILPNF